MPPPNGNVYIYEEQYYKQNGRKEPQKGKGRRQGQKGEEGRRMKTEKRSFISYLKGLYKKEKDPLLKGLIKELKKRQLGFYTRDDSRKSLVLVHKRLWHENKMPNDEWPDLFTKWNNDDKHETLLVWLEAFGMIPELATESLKDFLTDDEEEEGDRLPYIQ